VVAPRQKGHVDIAKRNFRVRCGRHARQQRKRTVVQLHHHALERGLRFLVRYFQHLQDDRLILPEHFSACDAKQQAVADLTGSAGDCNSEGLFHMLGTPAGVGWQWIVEWGLHEFSLALCPRVCCGLCQT